MSMIFASVWFVFHPHVEQLKKSQQTNYLRQIVRILEDEVVTAMSYPENTTYCRYLRLPKLYGFYDIVPECNTTLRIRADSNYGDSIIYNSYVNCTGWTIGGRAWDGDWYLYKTGQNISLVKECG